MILLQNLGPFPAGARAGSRCRIPRPSPEGARSGPLSPCHSTAVPIACFSPAAVTFLFRIPPFQGIYENVTGTRRAAPATRHIRAALAAAVSLLWFSRDLGLGASQQAGSGHVLGRDDFFLVHAEQDGTVSVGSGLRQHQGARYQPEGLNFGEGSPRLCG